MGSVSQSGYLKKKCNSAFSRFAASAKIKTRGTRHFAATAGSSSSADAAAADAGGGRTVLHAKVRKPVWPRASAVGLTRNTFLRPSSSCCSSSPCSCSSSPSPSPSLLLRLHWRARFAAGRLHSSRMLLATSGSGFLRMSKSRSKHSMVLTTVYRVVIIVPPSSPLPIPLFLVIFGQTVKLAVSN